MASFRAFQLAIVIDRITHTNGAPDLAAIEPAVTVQSFPSARRAAHRSRRAHNLVLDRWRPAVTGIVEGRVGLASIMARSRFATSTFRKHLHVQAL